MSQLHVRRSLDHMVIPSNCVVPFLLFFPLHPYMLRSGTLQFRHSLRDQQASMLMGISSCLITAVPNIYFYILNPYILAESSVFYLLSFIFVIFLYSLCYCFKDKCLCQFSGGFATVLQKCLKCKEKCFQRDLKFTVAQILLVQ